jgi:hypothetical protein
VVHWDPINKEVQVDRVWPLRFQGSWDKEVRLEKGSGIC